MLVISALASLSACTCGEEAPGGGGKDTGSDGDGPSSLDDSGGSDDDASVVGCGLNTCALAQATCGPIGDGCGHVLNCGSCTAPQSCGGGGVPSACGGNTSVCVAKTCAGLGLNCGPVGDGCGGLLQCGTCGAGESCGLGGPSLCGPSNGGGPGTDGGGVTACTAKTCSTVGANCGPVADGCGGLLNCGTCTASTSCGGGGAPSVCGAVLNACIPRTCLSVGASCGPVADGCGGLLHCGTCSATTSCGGGGMPNACGYAPADGGSSCVPRTCADEHANCGPVGDGCGGLLSCGVCPAPETCGGGGVASQCGGSNGCVPKTCASVGATCGPVADGCGGLLQCGTCPSPQSCGGGGHANTCGLASQIDAGPSCVPKTCAQQSATCGPVGDGCGGMLSCGSCTVPKTCGGGGVPSQCGGTQGCVPRTCASAGANCGPVADGCGAMLSCGSCTAPLSCGAGGVASVCGNPPDAGPACVAKTCAQQGVTCGPAGNGCGGTLSCGSCTAPQTCGGGGTASQCGGNSGCVPRTCASVGANCGPVADGCGGVLSCGSCTAPKTCGAGGQASVCGTTPDAGPACTPKTCASVGANCGPVSDGCGAQLNCGSCTLPQVCGGGGTPNVCGGNVPACVPKTCADLGANCGPVADGCGNIIPCGSCNPPDICGGGGVPSVCGGVTTDGGIACTNLCLQQVQCMQSGVTTTLTGTVVAPTPAIYGSPDPIYNALVYIPNSPVQPFKPGVSCDRCGEAASGSPLVTAQTGPNGAFTLTNVPVGTNIPLVIQLGRWRRQITISNVPACTTTKLTLAQTRLPRNHTEGDIPLMSMVTGKVDSLECVLRKIGIDDSEFSVSASQGGTGRVQFFKADNSGSGANVAVGNAPSESTLFSSTAAISLYDLVFFACEGSQFDELKASQQNVLWYANHGGRVYATHYSYVWLYNFMPFSQTGSWNVDTNVSNPPNDPLDALVDQSFPKGADFAQWLTNVGSSTATGYITIHVPRRDINAVDVPAQRWIYANTNPESIEHYTFNTPWGVPSDQQCGRVLFSDFHVNNVGSSHNVRFPSECTSGPMTEQDKILEFMIFDLASCIAPDVPSCAPRTCAQAGASCGPVGDGCGAVLNCGSCTAPQTCGGGGTPSVCGGNPCVPKTCAQEGISCGPSGDGCGDMLSCGTCTAPKTCGGGGTPGVCGNLDAGVCVPRTCAQQGLSCGPAGDGCGG